MRGRRPIGPELAEQLEGTAPARMRVRLILETITGATRVHEACEQLGICSQRFEAIRAEAIRAAIAALEPQPLGRPRGAERTPDVARLEARVAELEAELRAANVRAELAGQLPQRDRAAAKKAPPRSGRAKESHRSRPGHSRSTN
jgi:hypothetical protein